jgi:hypothetical protein
MKLQLLPFPLIAQVCHRPWPSGKRLQPPIHETAIIIIEDQKEMIHIIKSLKHNNQNNINIQNKLHTIKNTQNISLKNVSSHQKGVFYRCQICGFEKLFFLIGHLNGVCDTCQTGTHVKPDVYVLCMVVLVVSFE